MIHGGTTRLAGVMGWPVAHSLSPRLHGYWLARYRIDGAYVPLAVREADFALAVRGLAACGFAGLNVTVPHKQAAFAVCDVVSAFARRAGAVNTIVFTDGLIHGSNTDGEGFLRSLADQGFAPGSGPALIVGAGGAARAIAAALQDAGVAVTVTSRRADAAGALADSLGVGSLAWSARERALAEFGLVVNATTGGMTGKPALALGLAAASARLVVADIVYAPRETPLLAEARARGLRAIEGLGMLLHQAGLGFAAWFGVEPAVDDALRDFMQAG